MTVWTRHMILNTFMHTNTTYIYTYICIHTHIHPCTYTRGMKARGWCDFCRIPQGLLTFAVITHGERWHLPSLWNELVGLLPSGLLASISLAVKLIWDICAILLLNIKNILYVLFCFSHPISDPPILKCYIVYLIPYPIISQSFSDVFLNKDLDFYKMLNYKTLLAS